MTAMALEDPRPLTPEYPPEYECAGCGDLFAIEKLRESPLSKSPTCPGCWMDDQHSFIVKCLDEAYTALGLKMTVENERDIGNRIIWARDAAKIILADRERGR